MPMIDVKSAKDLKDLARQCFINFHELGKKMDIINDEVYDFGNGNSTGTKPTGKNTFDIIYIGDTNTYITKDSSGDLTFHDANAGTVTLTQLKLMAAIFWSFGDAFGIKMGNLANQELMIGITEDADGVTIFNSTSEVE